MCINDLCTAAFMHVARVARIAFLSESCVGSDRSSSAPGNHRQLDAGSMISLREYSVIVSRLRGLCLSLPRITNKSPSLPARMKATIVRGSQRTHRVVSEKKESGAEGGGEGETIKGRAIKIIRTLKTGNGFRVHSNKCLSADNFCPFWTRIIESCSLCSLTLISTLKAGTGSVQKKRERKVSRSSMKRHMRVANLHALHGSPWLTIEDNEIACDARGSFEVHSENHRRSGRC